jgi:hypothetical protein
MPSSLLLFFGWVLLARQQVKSLEINCIVLEGNIGEILAFGYNQDVLKRMKAE